jgi:hypothetical protein
MRRATLFRLCLGPAVLAAMWGSGCGAKVAPPVFEEDDPRALAASGATAEATTPDATAGAARDEAVEPDSTGERAAARGAASPGVAPAALAPRPPVPAGPARRSGAIERAALLRVLDAGPGNLLRGVEVSPWFEGQRFIGWRLEQIVDPGSPVLGVDLAVGDIVVAVNRRPLARPEHVMAIWQELRRADELVCLVWRGGGAFTLRFAIAPAVGADAATPSDAIARPPAAPAPDTRTSKTAAPAKAAPAANAAGTGP